MYQIEDVKLAIRMVKQVSEVMKTFDILQAYDRPTVGDRPVLAFLAEDIRGHEDILESAARGVLQRAYDLEDDLAWYELFHLSMVRVVEVGSAHGGGVKGRRQPFCPVSNASDLHVRLAGADLSPARRWAPSEADSDAEPAWEILILLSTRSRDCGSRCRPRTENSRTRAESGHELSLSCVMTAFFAFGRAGRLMSARPLGHTVPSAGILGSRSIRSAATAG
jgi:hypothetical protein